MFFCTEVNSTLTDDRLGGNRLVWKWCCYCRLLKLMRGSSGQLDMQGAKNVRWNGITPYDGVMLSRVCRFHSNHNQQRTAIAASCGLALVAGCAVVKQPGSVFAPGQRLMAPDGWEHGDSTGKRDDNECADCLPGERALQERNERQTQARPIEGGVNPRRP